MSFYSAPAFFVLVAVMVVPAFILGIREKSLRIYGFVASIAFLLLLFSSSITEFVAFAFFLVLATVLTFLMLGWFKSEVPRAVARYRACLLFVILPLAVTKVSGIFDSDLLGFIGISYITFKAVQVLIEIRDGLIVDMGLTDYLYFLIFFPSFTSGPILRSRDFIGQLHEPLSREAYLTLLSRGCIWFLKGAVYSFVLSTLAQWFMWFVPSALGTADTGSIVFGQLAYTLGYGLYLFFDFAGYSFMAMGIGAILGIRVPTNFRAPFCSVDIKDFWTRWHITLSYWLRDFVFMRIMRSLLKHKVFSSRLTAACYGLMANMVLMGAWHGLTVDYLAYGAFHGLLLCICEVYQKKSKFYKRHRRQRWFKSITWAITMVAVFFAFALFSGQVSSCLKGAFSG